MNFKANTLISFTALILGIVVLCYIGRPITNIVLFICGLAFVVPGILTLLGLSFKHSAENHSAADRALRFICGIGGLGLGVVVWCMPDVFRPLLVYLFGILLIAGGIHQCAQLSRKARAAQYPGWLIFGALVILVGGVVLIVVDFFHKPAGVDDYGNEKWVLLTTGIGAVIYGVNGLIITSYAYSQHRRDTKALKAAQKAEAETATKPETASEKAEKAEKEDAKAPEKAPEEKGTEKQEKEEKEPEKA